MQAWYQTLENQPFLSCLVALIIFVVLSLVLSLGLAVEANYD